MLWPAVIQDVSKAICSLAYIHVIVSLLRVFCVHDTISEITQAAIVCMQLALPSMLTTVHCLLSLMAMP